MSTSLHPSPSTSTSLISTAIERMGIEPNVCCGGWSEISGDLPRLLSASDERSAMRMVIALKVTACTTGVQ